MKRQLATLSLISAVLLAGCAQLPTSESDQDSLATAVAATLAAAPQGEPASGSPTEDVEDKGAPTAMPTAEPAPVLSMQQYLLAYTNDGDLWTLLPDGSTQRLTDSGDVVDVLLSGDRQLIVYVRQTYQPDLFEVRAVKADGANDKLLLSQVTLDALYPLDGALHYLTSQIEFIPGTHTLLFNTRATFDGPGLVKNDDLYRLDVDTGEITQILTRQRGGDFSVSPDGSKLALSKPDSISMAAIDGSNLRPDLITFQPIITYSEYQYYPIVVWSPDSSVLGVFIPSEDPLAGDPTGTVWIVPADAAPRSFQPIAGQAFFPQSNASLLSPDMQTVAFLREDDQGQTRLFLSNLDGSNSRVYDQGDIQWIGWNPDGTRFAFRKDQTSLLFGHPQDSPQLLAEGRTLRWLTADLFMVQSGSRGDWSLTIGHLDGRTEMLVQPSGESFAYDLK